MLSVSPHAHSSSLVSSIGTEDFADWVTEEDFHTNRLKAKRTYKVKTI